MALQATTPLIIGGYSPLFQITANARAAFMLQRGRMNYVVEAEALNLFVDMKN
jgi:hypothetical protein